MSQIRIPTYCVPRAPVDYDMEQRQLLRQDLVLSDGFRVPPLTCARLIALELVCSQFFLRPGSCDLIDAAAAVVLLTCDRELLPELTTPAAALHDQSVGDDSGGGPDSGLHGLSAAYPNLAELASAWLSAHGDILVADYRRLVAWILDVPFYGFAMRPRTAGGSPRECWFDGEFVGGVVAPAAKLLATPVESILWDTPLCTIGHAIAQQDASLGVKGVERPPDEAVLRRMMREAAEREARGELHPWQFADPLAYDLTAEQFKANPNLGPFFQALRAEFERRGRRPLDPADYPLPDPPAPEPAPDFADSGESIGIVCPAPDTDPGVTLTITVTPLVASRSVATAAVQAPPAVRPMGPVCPVSTTSAEEPSHE